MSTLTQKQKVEKVATDLCIANNTVTTLEIKNELRKSFPKEPWYQSDVSKQMAELNDDGVFDYIDNGTNRVYSLVSKTLTTVKQPAFSKRTGTKTISRTKALELIEGSGGKFFKVKFTKKDQTEREMTCQYVKAIKKSPLGYVNLKDVVAMRKGEARNVKSVNLQTLSEVKLSGVTYKVK